MGEFMLKRVALAAVVTTFGLGFGPAHAHSHGELACGMAVAAPSGCVLSLDSSRFANDVDHAETGMTASRQILPSGRNAPVPTARPTSTADNSVPRPAALAQTVPAAPATWQRTASGLRVVGPKYVPDANERIDFHRAADRVQPVVNRIFAEFFLPVGSAQAANDRSADAQVETALRAKPASTIVGSGPLATQVASQ